MQSRRFLPLDDKMRLDAISFPQSEESSIPATEERPAPRQFTEEEVRVQRGEYSKARTAKAKNAIAKESGMYGEYPFQRLSYHLNSHRGGDQMHCYNNVVS